MATVNALKKYVTDSNDALELKLVRTPDDVEDDSKIFKPDMTHQVFGDSESIFGYSNLRVKLYYSAGSLQTYVGLKFSEKIDNNSSREFKDVKADDVLSKLVPYLAPGFYTNIDEFRSAIDKEKKFIPYGTLHHSFTISKDGVERKFVIYQCEATNKDFLTYHSHLQTFLLWYVDASSFIDVDDPQWTFFVIYEKYVTETGNTMYAVAGYSTVYKYYAYPNHIRPRISQMLVFPPFQKMGLGTALLEAIYMHFVPLPNVIDITVEDPSEEFQRLRDYVDAHKCSELKSFSKTNLEKGYSKEMGQEAQSKLKLNLKQIRRIYEILRLKETNMNDEQQYKAYRLAVKQRLNSPYRKQQIDMKKIKRVLKPADFITAMSIFGKEEHLNQLSLDYKRLEEAYKQVVERLLRDSS